MHGQLWNAKKELSHSLKWTHAHDTNATIGLLWPFLLPLWDKGELNINFKLLEQTGDKNVAYTSLWMYSHYTHVTAP